MNSNNRQEPDFNHGGWPEDSEGADYVSLPQGPLKWLSQRSEVSTALGKALVTVQVLDHSGAMVLKPGEEERIARFQAPLFLSSVLSSKQEMSATAFMFLLELLGLKLTDLATFIGVQKSCLSNFKAGRAVSPQTAHSVAMALLLECVEPGFIKASLESETVNRPNKNGLVHKVIEEARTALAS